MILRQSLAAVRQPVPVHALFVRRDSVYKTMPSVDAFDADRDARSVAPIGPIVAHPPCRGWGRMRQFASLVRADEKALAQFAVRAVQAHGGVLEHPARSSLWLAECLPLPGDGPDAHGGFTVELDQFHFGHRAEKRTWLYVCPAPGVALQGLPPIPQRPGEPTHCVRPTKHYPRLPSITKAEREHTPTALALWLVEVARRCAGQGTPGFTVETPAHPGPRRWNQDPALTGDAHRLLKRELQLRHARPAAQAQA